MSENLNVEIISVTPAASGVMAELHKLIFPPAAQSWDQKAFLDLLSMPGASAWLAVDCPGEDQVPVGLALVRFAAQEGEIITIGVLPEFRRHGIAQKLLQTIIDRAEELGADLLLEVASLNNEALKLYCKNGFEDVGRRRNYYQRAGSTADDALVLKRELPKR